ncbi:hypothetical protein TRVA0_018S01860 [Trichomonascus vanleenenianus]|uniref:Sov1p n=1 Tax=Trichomonascus vanleenenianus TaxID=2268995 RepID=UPI003EC99720
MFLTPRLRGKALNLLVLPPIGPSRGVRTLPPCKPRHLSKAIPRRGSFLDNTSNNTRRKVPEKVAIKQFKQDDETMRELYALQGRKVPKIKAPKTLFQMNTRILSDYVDIVEMRLYPDRYKKRIWRSLKILIKTPRKPRVDKPPLDLLLDIFESAKVQAPSRRNALVKRAGDAIYSFGVRLDPINESIYLDAIFNCGAKAKALQIWQSRRGKPDVKNWLYWPELGGILYLRRFDTSSSEEIAKSMKQQFGVITTALIVEFVNIYLQKGDRDNATWWYNQIKELAIANQRLENVDVRSSDSPLTAEQAAEIANTNRGPSVQNFKYILDRAIESHAWKLAALVMVDLQRFSVKVSLNEVMACINQATVKMTEKKPAKRRQKIRASRALYGVNPAGSSQFVDLLTSLIGLEPTLLHNKQLYHAWVQGLVGHGMYKNAIEVVEAMAERGLVEQNDKIYLTLLSSLLSKRQHELSFEYLHRTGSLNPELYSMLLQYAVSRRDRDLVQKVEKKMEEDQVAYTALTFNNLLSHYYEQRDFGNFGRLLNFAISHNKRVQQSSFREIWRLLRKLYQPGVNNKIVDVDLRLLVKAMVTSPNFKPSQFLYEIASHALLLSGDAEGAAGLLCYMDEVNSANIPGIMAMSIIQLGYKMNDKVKLVFPPVPRKDSLITKKMEKPPQTLKEGNEEIILSEPMVPWKKVVIQLATVMNRHNPDHLVEEAINAKDYYSS